MNEEKGQFCAYLSNLHSSFEDCETFVATKMKRNFVKEGVEIKKSYYVFMLHCLRFDKSLKRILLHVMLEYHNYNSRGLLTIIIWFKRNSENKALTVHWNSVLD